MNFSYFYFLIFCILLIKFFLIFGASYYYFWMLKPAWIEKYRIQIKPRSQALPWLELKYSFINLFIVGAFVTCILYYSNWGQMTLQGNQIEIFKIYAEWDLNNIYKELLAIVFFIFYYDAYFYFSHKLLHTQWLYKNIHIVHHRSLNPTPLASYSFHPIEGFINLLYLIPFFILIPTHIVTFIVLHLISDISNWNGHVGFDFIPRYGNKSILGLTTPTHHNLHHQVSKFNFGLYWSGWDKIFNTLHPDTEKEFLRVKNQK